MWIGGVYKTTALPFPKPVSIKASQHCSCQKNKITRKLWTPERKFDKSVLIIAKSITDVIRMSSYQEILNHKTSFSTDPPPAVWYNPSPRWETIDNPACYIRYIRALCSERTSNHSNELYYWNHSTVREPTAGFQDKWTLQFHLSSTFVVFVSLFSWDVA